MNKTEKKKIVPYLFPFFIENNKAIVMKHHLKFYKPVGTFYLVDLTLSQISERNSYHFSANFPRAEGVGVT